MNIDIEQEREREVYFPSDGVNMVNSTIPAKYHTFKSLWMYGIDDCFHLSAWANFTVNFVILHLISWVTLFNGNKFSFFFIWRHLLVNFKNEISLLKFQGQQAQEHSHSSLIFTADSLTLSKSGIFSSVN